MALKVLNTAETTVVGGRDGHVKSKDGILDLDLENPASMGGHNNKGETNPEMLFAAGWGACFDSMLAIVAKARRDEIKSETTVRITLLETDDGAKLLVAEIRCKIHGIAQKEADIIVEAANRACPYSKATKGNIALTVKAIVD